VIYLLLRKSSLQVDKQQLLADFHDFERVERAAATADAHKEWIYDSKIGFVWNAARPTAENAWNAARSAAENAEAANNAAAYANHAKAVDADRAVRSAIATRDSYASLATDATERAAVAATRTAEAVAALDQ